MQIEIKRLQHQLNATVLFVTHDQDEALAMADRIAVINNGRIEQISDPRAIYRQPETLFVSRFVGDSNQFDGTVVGHDPKTNEIVLQVGEAMLRGMKAGVWIDEFPNSDKAALIVRPEDIVLKPVGQDAALNGTVKEVIFTGSGSTVVIDVDVTEVQVQISAEADHQGRLTRGEKIGIDWAPDKAHVFSLEAEG